MDINPLKANWKRTNITEVDKANVTIRGKRTWRNKYAVIKIL